MRQPRRVSSPCRPHAQGVSGFRVEARGGWEQVGASASIPNPDEDEDEDGDEFLTGSDDDSGADRYGLEAGYDAQDRLELRAWRLCRARTSPTPTSAAS